jgi:HPt (histidine-containing phosphotransfer) domain-containing protein
MIDAGLVARECPPVFLSLYRRRLSARPGFGQSILSWSEMRRQDRALTRFPCLNRANKDLAELSSLGHFLKGSSATLGFLKVKDSCQVIQQYGHKLNLDGSPEADEQVCLSKITEALQAAKDDMAKLETMLKKFFGEASD